MKICIASSAGGHITELLQIKDVWKAYDHFYIVVEREDTKDFGKKEQSYFVDDTGRNAVSFIKNLYQSFKIILKERPDVIITTGAGAALPACFWAKLLGAKIIFIESFCRLDKTSLSGKMIYPFSDIFLVQWKKLLKLYGSKAQYRGAVF